MKKKHENIFWHQGIKIYSEESLTKEEVQTKISHLENDVTKSLLNIFQLTDKRVLKKFLSFINVIDSAETFEFDFQVFDSNKYRHLPERMMLSIVSSSTSIISNPNYSKNNSIPDGALFNDHKVILIESKTQSPLVREQIASHIKYYLGSATYEKIITWEDITVIFTELDKRENITNSFLLNHFIDFLEFIGISKFNGFKRDDFEMLSLINSIPREEYLDYKRIFSKKVENFMRRLNENLKQSFSQYNLLWKCAKINPVQSGDWSAFYFSDKRENIHVNQFPNINFNYRPYGIELALNAETKPAVEFFLKKLKSDAKLFNEVFKKLDDFYFALFYKIQFRPKDNFYWDLIYGYPKILSEFDVKQLEVDLESTQRNWINIINTFIYKISNGDIQKSNNKFYTEKEINFTKVRNPNPNYAIRINKKYSASEIDNKKNKQIIFYTNEIKRLSSLIKLLFHDTNVET